MRMKKFTLYDRKAILSNPASLHGYFGWPTVARLKNGDLAAVASGFRVEHVCPFGKTVLARSKNEGKTWSLPTPIIDTPLDDRDGGILAFGESSLLVTSFNNCPEYQKYYMDICRRNRWLSENLRAYCDAMSNFVFRDGRAEDFWGATYRVSHDNGVTWSEIYKSPVTSPHGPMLHEGKILWVGTTMSDGLRPAKVKELQCWKMDGKGEMTYLSSLPNVKGQTSCEPHAISLPDGRILVHIRMEPDFATWQTESRDGGLTWSIPYRVHEEKSGAPAHLFLHSKGRLFSTVGYRTRPDSGIRAFTSDDMGKTWEYAVLTDGLDHWDVGYPSVTELADGRLYLVWYENQGKGSLVYGAAYDPYE